MTTSHPTFVPTVGDTPKDGSVLGFYAPKGTRRPPQVARGEGIYLWDVDGRRQASKVTYAYPRFFESEHNIRLSDRQRRANKGEFGDFQMITPPLTCTGAEIDELVLLLGKALDDLHAEARSEALAR